MERNLVHGPGDLLGQPFRLHPVWRGIIYRLYELTPAGDRRWKHALIGMAKGNVKSEMAAAVAITELAGPVSFGGWREDGRPIGVERVSPEIPVAAASFEQADLVFGSATEMIRKGPLANHFEVFDTEIMMRERSGKLFRVAAVAPTNDGGRPTFAVRDEIHEWTGKKRKLHQVLGNNLRKRNNTWALDISTASDDPTSLLNELVARGKRIAEGKEPDQGFLMIWFEGDKELDLLDPIQFELACQQANPVRFNLAHLRECFGTATIIGTLPEHDFRRYHLNQFTRSPRAWLPKGAWAAAADAQRGVPADGTSITLALEGNWDNLSIALVGCTIGHAAIGPAAPDGVTDSAPAALARHLFIVEVWEPDPSAEEGEDGSARAKYQPPKRGDLKTAITDACARWQVQAIAANPSRWAELFAELEGETLPMVEWPVHVTARITAACKQLYDALVVDHDVTHDGDLRFATHVAEAHVFEDSHERTWITKAPLAVAGVLAYDAAVRSVEASDDLGLEFM